MSAAVTVKLPEALDAKYARKLWRELKVKTGTESPRVALDLSRVKDIDLSGLQALLSCMDQLAKQDGGLQLSGVSPEIATIFELTRMDRLMERFAAFTLDAPEFEIAAEPAVEEVGSETPVQLPVAA